VITAGERGIDALRSSLRGRPFELGAVVASGIGFLLFGLSFPYIATASVFWVAYVLVRYRWDPDVFARWGFRKRGFGAAVRLTFPYGAVGIGFCLVYGLLSERALVNANLPLLLLIYPPWGAIQQFLVVALIGENLVALGRGRLGEPAAVIITALAFAGVHMPEYPLVAATFFLGLVTTSVYFRTKNLWVPGILHGWFATLFYFLVMGKDPWTELIVGGFRF
jgi:membrane protease YdiL (CAAX protease family)